MPTFYDELEIMRRFLRDPDGNIWSNEDILTYWNDAQRELDIKAGYGEKAEAIPFPPQWTWSHLFPWEFGYVDGDRYQCLLLWQGANACACYPWEPSYWLDTFGPPDDGYRFVHPWEAFIVGDPADPVPFPLNTALFNIRYMAFDRRGMEPADRKSLSLNDSQYRTAAGTPVYYWRPDQEGNQAVLYPRPTNITWDDGGLLHSPSETYDDAGGINSFSTSQTDASGFGAIIDSLDLAGNVFVLYDDLTDDIESPGDEIDAAPYLVKYIRYGCLERCFGADTDGFIPTLRDYWKMRKEIGFKAIKKLSVLKNSDRDYRLGGGGRVIGSRHPRLPAEYPRQGR